VRANEDLVANREAFVESRKVLDFAFIANDDVCVDVNVLSDAAVAANP